MTDTQGNGGIFGFNGWGDLFNGGGKGGTFLNPREGYNGFFSPAGLGRGLGGFLAGPLGAAGGGWLGNWIQGLGGGNGGDGEPTTNPWDQIPWAGNDVTDGVSTGSNDYGWFGGQYNPFLGAAGISASGGPRDVYVGNYGGAGDAWTNMFPNFGGDDVGAIDPEYRRALMGGGNPAGIIGNPNVSYSSPDAWMEGLYGRNDGAVQFTPNHAGQFLGFPRGAGGIDPAMFGGGGAVDFSNFLIPPGGGGGGGGGRGRQDMSGQGQSQAAGNQFLTDAFQNMPDFSIDPNLQGMINGLVQQGAGGYDQFSNQLLNNPFMGAMAGMLGGGGGGFGGGGYSSGGGGSYNPNVAYRDIPPHMVELLENMRNANIGRLDMQTADLQDSMVADLFGRGVQRSDLALDEVGRLNYGQGQLMNDLNAAIDAQRMGLIENDLNSQTAIAQSQIAAAAQRAAAASSAGAQRFGAQAGLLGSMFGDYSRSLASGFGANQGALTNFAGILGDIGLGEAGLNQGAFLGLGDFATRANESQDDLAGDRAAANASRYGAQLGYNSNMLGYGLDQQRLNNDFLFNMLNFGEGQRQFDADLGLRNRIFEQGIPDDSDRWLALLGMLGGAAGNYFGNRQGGGG